MRVVFLSPDLLTSNEYMGGGRAADLPHAHSP